MITYDNGTKGPLSIVEGRCRAYVLNIIAQRSKRKKVNDYPAKSTHNNYLKINTSKDNGDTNVSYNKNNNQNMNTECIRYDDEGSLNVEKVTSSLIGDTYGNDASINDSDGYTNLSNDLEMCDPLMRDNQTETDIFDELELDEAFSNIIESIGLKSSEKPTELTISECRPFISKNTIVEVKELTRKPPTLTYGSNDNSFTAIHQLTQNYAVSKRGMMYNVITKRAPVNPHESRAMHEVTKTGVNGLKRNVAYAGNADNEAEPEVEVNTTIADDSTTITSVVELLPRAVTPRTYTSSVATPTHNDNTEDDISDFESYGLGVTPVTDVVDVNVSELSYSLDLIDLNSVTNSEKSESCVRIIPEDHSADTPRTFTLDVTHTRVESNIHNDSDKDYIAGIKSITFDESSMSNEYLGGVLAVHEVIGPPAKHVEKHTPVNTLAKDYAYMRQQNLLIDIDEDSAIVDNIPSLVSGDIEYIFKSSLNDLTARMSDIKEIREIKLKKSSDSPDELLSNVSFNKDLKSEMKPTFETHYDNRGASDTTLAFPYSYIYIYIYIYIYLPFILINYIPFTCVNVI